MKTELDKTDAEILSLLVTNGRMAYTEIADEVEMSPPSVIERVERLREKGVLRGFEARLDRSVLGGSRLLVRFRAPPDEASRLADEIAEDERAETVFVSADRTVTVVANAEPEGAYGIVDDVDARDYDVEVVAEERHEPTVAAPSFAPDCVECGNTVDEEGVTARIAGDVHHFCCTSCESAFRERYEAMG